MMEYIAGDPCLPICVGAKGIELRVVQLRSGDVRCISIPEAIGTKLMALFNGERLFVAHYGLGTYCYDVRTAAVLWHNSEIGMSDIRLDAHGKVLVETGADFGVRCIDIFSGDVVSHSTELDYLFVSQLGKWTAGVHSAGVEIQSTDGSRFVACGLVPIVDAAFGGGHLLLSTLRELCAVDLNGGQIRWSREYKGEQSFLLSSDADERKVYGIAGQRGGVKRVMEIDVASGDVTELFNLECAAPFAFCNNGEYVVTGDGCLYGRLNGALIAANVFSH